MNTATAIYPTFGNQEDFANSVAAATRRFNRFDLAPVAVAPVFYVASFAIHGIAESVHNVVIDRSASLSPMLRKRITELSNLDSNWDSEGAKTIKSYVLADAVEILKRFAQRPNNFKEPFLAPTFDGFIQIEWHFKTRSLEIEAVNDGWSLVGTEADNDGKRVYFTAECERSEFEKLERFYEWVQGTELIWPLL